MEYSPTQHLRKSVRIDFSGSPSSGNNDSDKDKSPPPQKPVPRLSTVVLAERVKEVFKRFDKNGDGFLDYGELTRAMKSLSGSTEERELKKFFEMDTNNNKLVSINEFVTYALHGPEARMFRHHLQSMTGVARQAQLREVFNRYDSSNDGFLEIDELETVLRSLGAFTHHEVMAVCQDLDTSGDGQVSFDEWLAWMGSGKGSHVVTKAKAILAPSDDDGLESVFYMFCSSGRSDMDAQSFIRMFRDANLCDKKLTEVSLNLIFNSCSKRGEKRMIFERFEPILKNVAEGKGVPLTEVRNALLQVCGPRLLGTKAIGPRIPAAKDQSPTSLARSTIAESSCRRASTPLTGVNRRASTADSASNTCKSSSDRRSSSPSTPIHTGTPLSPPVDNRNLWKAFGIDLEAGRKLKTLYGGGKLEPRSKHAKKMSLSDEETYLVVNGLNCGSAGLQFRRSMNIFDICRGTREFVAWGEVVRGIRVDACWVKVGEKFLPTHVNKVKFLHRKHTPPSPMGHRTLPSQSMPDLSKFGRQGNSMWGRSLDFVLVGKPAYQQESDDESSAYS